MQTKFKCKNFKPGYMFCETCVLTRRYIDLQNSNCKSCFEAELNEIKPV